MRPLTFINGVIFASLTALTGVLGIIVFLRWIMSIDPGLDQSVIRNSLPLRTLGQYILLFGILAVIAGAAFWAELRQQRWRWGLEAVLAFGLAAALVYFLAGTGDRLRDLALLGAIGGVCAVLWLLGRATGLTRRLQAWLEE
ncbi:MAG TPA: hypothetical protein VFM15_10190 [Gammaproteobacteria bacterium]|nr:hypothetical protein [Gammaproteobacteria bacterium]